MITQCNECRQYRSEETPTPCPDCSPVLVKRVMCGNSCGRPATVVTGPVGFVFCSTCYEGFVLGQGRPDETVVVDDARYE